MGTVHPQLCCASLYHRYHPSESTPTSHSSNAFSALTGFAPCQGGWSVTWVAAACVVVAVVSAQQSLLAACRTTLQVQRLRLPHQGNPARGGQACPIPPAGRRQRWGPRSVGLVAAEGGHLCGQSRHRGEPRVGLPLVPRAGHAGCVVPPETTCPSVMMW